MYSKTGTVVRECDNIGTQEVQGQTHVDFMNIDISGNEQQLGEKANANARFWSG